ncbi:ABC transporter ATP-binding protein [Acidicapsa dinghuensis]|uniref:ABC transporter ATP-binding protein n=1 Tax=Acidicapsa dinghuensis TaxID=2218256 RepID=A0ABW1EIM1_9BACT|nr:ABC transporter ATP-binding protein [Acidicapsa dinghuensis]
MADEKNKPKRADDEISGKTYDARLMRRLAGYLGPYRIQATVSVIAVILKAGSDVVGPYLVKVGLDRYLTQRAATAGVASSNWLGSRLSNDPYVGLGQLAAMYLGALLLAYAFEFTQTYLMQWTGQKVMFDLRSEIFRHMQRMHIGFFDNHAVGRLVTRLTSDVDAINDMFTSGVLSMIDDLFALSIMVIVMLNMNWRLALLTLSVLPVIVLVTHLFRKSVRESYRRVRAAIARINSFTQEHISGMSVVQLFNREERAFKDFTAVNEQHMVAFKDTIFAYALYYPAVEILSSIAIAFIVWRGGFGVINGAVTIGVLAAFTQYSQRFFRPIMDLSEKFNILQAAMAACERIFKLLDTPAEIVSPVETKAGDASNRIEFRNVWFTYQLLAEEQRAQIASASASELAAMNDIEWILKDVSFTIEPGQTVAIVGHTGAGKTTLTGLMMRFYDVTRGGIYLDGIDLREHDLNTLRRHFAVVLQDPFLFTGTIAENIRLGEAEITTEQMASAAKDVNVLEFVESLSNGFEEPVIERGNSLSTGQKQLINFARALAYDPRILILDEATSSVDTETEQKIRLALERMVEGRTSVLIAHRLSTVQRADIILVMHKGQLREMGSHQQLLAQRGIYWKLYQLQYKDQEVASASISIGPAVGSGLVAGLAPELASGAKIGS